MPPASAMPLGSSLTRAPISDRPPGITAIWTSHQRADDDRLVPARADPDHRDRYRGHRLDGLDVATRVLRQVIERAGLGDVVVPARELLVHRHRVVEVGLRHRHLVVGRVADAVTDADGDRLEAGKYV